MPIQLNEEVGETKWQHGMATFCTPFTKSTVRYFDHAEAAEARNWLDQGEWKCPANSQEHFTQLRSRAIRCALGGNLRRLENKRFHMS